MKTKNIIINKLIIMSIMIALLMILNTTKKLVIENKIYIDSNNIIKGELILNKDEEIKGELILKEYVYDGLTKQELIDKLNRVMKHELAGKGELFVENCLAYGADPYIALAISLHETGCYIANCSYNVKVCHNIGGMVGGNCNGNFKRFETIDDGIVAFIQNLGWWYFSQGLNTPEKINPKYAEDPNWYKGVRNYVNIIKNS